MNANFRRAALAAALGLAMAGPAAAQAASLPTVQKSGSVEYMTGGVGQDEATAMEREAGRWPMALEFAVRDGKKADFAADVHVRIRDAERNVVLDTTADGPFVLAKLEPGRYRVEATLAGKTLRRDVTVGKGHARTLFEWPAGTDDETSPAG